MAVATAVSSGIAGGKARRNTTSGAWKRPADWLPLPAVGPAEQKLVGLFAVHNHDMNYVALVAAGAYTVDWGDGSAPENIATGVQAEHLYNWANLSSATVTSQGFRQAIVTVTPQAGNNLTSMNIYRRHSALTLVHGTGWLDIRLAGTFLTTITVINTNTVTAVTHKALAQFELVSHGNFSGTYLFNSCSGLARVLGFNNPGNNITAVISMFQGCTSLQSVPARMNIHPAITAITGMFSGCSSLLALPWLDTSNVTDFSSFASSCSSITSIPLYNTVKVTNFSSAFSVCYSLRTVPQLNTGAATQMVGTFQQCTALTTIPLLDTHASTSFNNLFNGCSNLTSVPALNTAACTNFSSMFAGCTNLTTIPLLNTTLGTTLATMFSGCTALESVPALDTSGVTAFSGLSGIFTGCISLSSSALANVKFSMSYSSARLSAAALNAIYTALASGVTAQTITVTNNYGIAGDDPTIATAKGWTVTGS